MLMLLHYDDGIDEKNWKQNKVFIMDVHIFTVRHVSRNIDLANTFSQIHVYHRLTLIYDFLCLCILNLYMRWYVCMLHVLHYDVECL